MTADMINYIEQRIQDLTRLKADLFATLQEIGESTTEEIIEAGRQELIEMKQRYYLVSGALAELEALKQHIVGN